MWCQENNLSLKVNKTKEMIEDFRKQQREHRLININVTAVEKVESFKEKQQNLFNLRRLKKFGLAPKPLTNLYRCTNEHPAWYGNCTARYHRARQKVVRSAQHITGDKLTALQDTYSTRCHRKAIKDNNHPSHCLFTPLSSRR